jgi:hypothetical protein
VIPLELAFGNPGLVRSVGLGPLLKGFGSERQYRVRGDAPRAARQGTELGPLQLAMWKRQFEALRDGDRFFYLNDPELATVRAR